MLRLEHVIDYWANTCPDHPAIIDGMRRWTYATLRAEMDRRAAMLVERGMESSTVIVTSAIASDDLVLTMLACARADLIFFH
ncbi:MAG: AMP-binding protein, partial [Chloroflexota bacterium]|nr:AMP-binding protein [Chloroflexota bacterium]